MNTLINMNPWTLLDELFDTQSRTSRFTVTIKKRAESQPQKIEIL